MYLAEREWDDAKLTDTQRTVLRQKYFKRTLKWLKAIAIKLRKGSLPISCIGKASDYVLGHWTQLKDTIYYVRTRLDTNFI